MVYFEDLDTPFDISMEDLPSWDDSEEHAAAHAGAVRNFEVVETAGSAIVVTYERNIRGVWQKARTRVTSFPPYCRFIEELEGEFAGSRFVGGHRPDGTRMKIDIYGDIQSKTMTGETLRKYWLEVLATSHAEDVAALRAFRKRVASPTH
ncbi:MAG TPA: hypothetical protein VFG07_07900 [Thermoplasmata archaeon]|nr:hypothetical protein [Thermoplasmata archaeon]